MPCLGSVLWVHDTNILPGTPRDHLRPRPVSVERARSVLWTVARDGGGELAPRVGEARALATTAAAVESWVVAVACPSAHGCSRRDNVIRFVMRQGLRSAEGSTRTPRRKRFYQHLGHRGDHSSTPIINFRFDRRNERFRIAVVQSCRKNIIGGFVTGSLIFF